MLQLEMIDSFAQCRDLKEDRGKILSAFSESVERLGPLYDEREQLQAQVRGLASLQEELREKAAAIPGEEEEEKRWAQATSTARALEGVGQVLNRRRRTPGGAASRTNHQLPGAISARLRRLWPQSAGAR